MEDEGRQRTTKYISHKCVSAYFLTPHYTYSTVVPKVVLLVSLDRSVGVSDHLQLFAKEQERYSTAAQTSDAAPATPKTAPTSKSAARRNARKSAAKKKSGRRMEKDADEVQQMCDTGNEGLDGKGGKTTEM